MIVNIAQVVVLIFGMVICALSAWGISAPEKILKFAKDTMDQDFGIYAAVVVRVLLGVALILAAGESSLPTLFQVLGWIAILAAVIIALVGRMRLLRFAAWFDRFSPSLVRVWLLVGLAFGGVLIYGVT